MEVTADDLRLGIGNRGIKDPVIANFKSKYITVKLFKENDIFTCVGLSERMNTYLITRIQIFFEKPRSAFTHARVFFDA